MEVGVKQKTSESWREGDFHAAHLRLIYDQYDNNIVREYLNGNLTGNRPILRSIL